jgi:hypothetical protein
MAKTRNSRVTLAELGQAGGGRAGALRALAELLAAGYVRAAIGPVPGDYAGSIQVVDGDNETRLLFAAPSSWQPLADDRTAHLLRMVDEIPGLSLGAVVFLHASLRIGHPADGGLTFDSDELEDYLGARRGSLADA